MCGVEYPDWNFVSILFTQKYLVFSLKHLVLPILHYNSPSLYRPQISNIVKQALGSVTIFQ